jgi:uncharacterized protein (DUF4415 family)
MAIQFRETAKPAAKPPAVKMDANPALPAGEQRPRGRPKSGKETITLRLSTAMLDKYRATGGGWQTRINDDLMKLNGL